MAKEIQQLTPGVVKKLRSGIAFMNVAHCVEELVLNSIDAEANCIAVNLNLPVYQIQVIDNGCGISAEQMNIIGTRYATSKCHTLEDLQNLKSGGFRGEALSSLKEISSALMIESRTASSADSYCKIFTQGKALEPKKSLNSRPSKGTTVTVYDFMYNLPVRKKSICEALDVEECRKLLQSIALMYPNISFTLQNEATGEMCLQLRKCSSLYNSFLQMFGQSKASNLKTIDYQTDICEISGCISTECYISKDLQFLYVNKRRVLRTKLHKLINRLLNKALSSKQKLNINSSSSASESSSPLKNQCHCIFVINISCPYDKYDIIFEPRKTIIEFSDWDSLLKVVEEALIDFLKREKLYSNVNETELNASNSKTQGNVLPTFDVQDFQQGLFSHVARRLKLPKSNDLHANERKSQNLDKNSHEASITEATSKYHNGSENTPSNVLRSPVSEKNIETSDKEISMDLRNAKSSSSLLSNLLGRVDGSTAKGTCEFVASSLLQTDFDIPCRSVFPSENPVMLRVPSKSALSNLQTSNNNNLKFLQMQEKIQCFVRKGNSNLTNKNKPQPKHDKVLFHSTEISSNKSAQISPVLCIDEKKYETKLKNMINKSAQCPSVSRVNSNSIVNKNALNNIFVAKETKDKSLQCPSVTGKNQTRVQSRFEFKDEPHALLQNLKKSKRVQKITLRKPHAEVSIVSDDNSTCFIDDNDRHKSKKFKSAHFIENFEISPTNEVKEKRIPEDFDINIETGNSSEIYKNNHPDVYVPDDIEFVSDSPRKIQNPDFYCKKSLDFNKFKSSFGLQSFVKVQKSKHPSDNISIFSEFGKNCQNEKMTYQSEGNFDQCTSENEVNSCQDLFPDIITDNIVHTPKEMDKRCYLTNLNLNSNFKENTGPFLTEKIHMECEKLNENTVDDINFNLSEISPSSSDVYRVVHSLVSNAVKINSLPCSPNAFVYNKTDGINDVNQNIHQHLSFQDEVITNSNMTNNKTVELHPNDNSDTLTIFGMKSISDNNLMPDAATKEHSLFHFKKSAVEPPEDPNPLSLGDKIASSPVLSVGDINFESDPFTQKLPAVVDRPLNVELNKSCTNTNSEVSLMFKEGLFDNFEMDCFTEKLLAASGNDIFKAPRASLVNSHTNRSMPNLDIRSDDDIELESDPFSEKLSAMPDNNSVRLPCTKLYSSGTKNETSASQMISVDGIELESDSLIDKHPTVPDNNSHMPSEIKLSETFSDKKHTTSDFEIKSTAEIEFESDALNKKLLTMSENPSLEKQFSEENDLNKNVPNTSSIELFNELSSSELHSNPKVSTEGQASETSVISPSIKDKGCIPINTDSHETDNLEIVGKTSTENDFTIYDHLKLHSQPECKRKIYVDSITGNSSYIVPEKSEAQQNEVTEANNGFLKKSHFFLTHDYSPFISKTQTPDKFKNDNCNVQSDLMDYVKNNEKYGYCDKWRKSQEELNCNENIENMLIAWDNPAFDIPYEVSSIGDDKITQSVSQMHVFLNSYRFSKTTLNTMQVIGQVDCKFIACILKDFNENCRDQRLLALFDQHAVHERIRLEELIEDLYKRDADDEKCIKTSAINPPLEISLSDEEVRLLQAYHEKLHKIGIYLKIDKSSHLLRVLSVPSCLIHKETGELRRSVSDTVTILQNSITEWLSSVVKTRSVPQVLPKTLSSVLNYQACRSAVKFGDPLNFEQCCDLMKSLSSCKLPFQCAHGRPSIAPILDLKKIEALYRKKPPAQLQMLFRSLKNS